MPRLIDANALGNGIGVYVATNAYLNDTALDALGKVARWLDEATTVDAVLVTDPELLKAIKLLIKQYGHSKQSEYVRSPVAHALFHTWKQVDNGR